MGYSGGNLSSKTSSFTPEHPADTPQAQYDFTRLMHFDNQSQRVLSRSYSPYLKKHTTDHSAFPKPYQEFVLSYAELGLKMKKKTLKTTHFSARFA